MQVKTIAKPCCPWCCVVRVDRVERDVLAAAGEELDVERLTLAIFENFLVVFRDAFLFAGLVLVLFFRWNLGWSKTSFVWWYSLLP